MQQEIILHRNPLKTESVFLDASSTWGDLLEITSKRFGNGSLYKIKSDPNYQFDNPKLIYDESTKLQDIHCWEFEIEAEVECDNDYNLRTIISHGKDRQIIIGGKINELSCNEKHDVKLDHKRWKRSEKILRLVTEEMGEGLYKCREYRINYPGDIEIGKTEDPADISIILNEDGFKSDPLKSRPIKEIDLQKNKKIIKATGEFLIDLVSKVAREVVKGAVQGAVQGAIGGGGGALMDETF